MGLKGERKNNDVKEVLLKISQSELPSTGREGGKNQKYMVWGSGMVRKRGKERVMGVIRIECTSTFYSLPRTDIMDPRLISIMD
jgi:hypothetical protein